MDKFISVLMDILHTQFDWFAFGLMIVMLAFAWMFYRAQTKKQLDWTDLITANNSTAVSLTKCLQLVGGAVGTWIMIKITVQGKMTWDLFAIYLSYVASVDGYSKFISAKYGLKPESNMAIRQNSSGDDDDDAADKAKIKVKPKDKDDS